MVLRLISSSYTSFATVDAIKGGTNLLRRFSNGKCGILRRFRNFANGEKVQVVSDCVTSCAQIKKFTCDFCANS